MIYIIPDAFLLSAEKSEAILTHLDQFSVFSSC